MAGKTDGESQSHFLTEDIVINILLRLPIASCIFRFRCVCRSWRILLSNPEFVHKILFFKTPGDQQSLRILIAGAEDTIPVRQIRYSLHSYDTLCPVSVVGDLPSVPNKIRNHRSSFRLTIVGCCDGIFCISDRNTGGPSDIILWNPTTSETKFLPVSPCPHAAYGRPWCDRTGFGFDPLTRDYKVVRVFKFQEGEDDNDDPEQLNRRHFSTYKEVYSLKNDSWKRSTDSSFCSNGWISEHFHQDTSQNEKCYWFATSESAFHIVSFDMGKEEFEETIIPAPLGEEGLLFVNLCYKIKESFVTTFESFYFDDDSSYEIWELMKFGASESWTKLFTFPSPAFSYNLEVWKDGTYIYSQKKCQQRTSNYRTPEDPDHEVFLLDPTTGKITGDCLELQERTHSFQAHTYSPTQVSLSNLS